MTKAEQLNKAVESMFWGGLENLIARGWTFDDFEEADIAEHMESFSDSTLEENLQYLKAMIEKGTAEKVDEVLWSDEYRGSVYNWFYYNLPIQEDDADRTESGYYKWGNPSSAAPETGIDFIFDDEAEGDLGVKNVLKVAVCEERVYIEDEDGEKVSLHFSLFWETFKKIQAGEVAEEIAECAPFQKALTEVWESVEQQ